MPIRSTLIRGEKQKHLFEEEKKLFDHLENQTTDFINRIFQHFIT